MYANIIINISHEQVDRLFQYLIPADMEHTVSVGSQVFVPFGRANRLIEGYVIGLSDEAEFDPDKIKSIDHIREKSVAVETDLIRLAAWIKERYGSTMIQALKTVMPVKKEVKKVTKRYYKLRMSEEELQEYLKRARTKNWAARIRMGEALLADGIIPAEVANEKLAVSPAVAKAMEEQGVLEVVTRYQHRDPITHKESKKSEVSLNVQQNAVIAALWDGYEDGDKRPCLLHGITGSGKTEVYMEIIERVRMKGQQAIVLIPEISLTYQTVMRFYKRFGSRVSVVNSKLSAGERYDQFERAKKGEIDIMIGPRSALFTPFEHLGLIIIDEEHENAYKSENMPRYHATDVAIERARMAGGMVVLGSATPSVASYFNAVNGNYRLFELGERAVSGSALPDVHVVDLRREFAEGNKSIFSRQLTQMIEERLQKKEQVMLFLNRRGYARAVSCRACGKAVGCPNCAVPLTQHNNGYLVCHYCGHREIMPSACPSCQSPYLAGFGLGTQKLEQMTRKTFPDAKILRMDRDTTAPKGGHEAILNAFSEGRADILIGTQMIVKGHDFPNVTLMGILAADMSLLAGDYRSTERTYQLLTQAAGRAGRGKIKGEVVIQTYDPDNYCITAAASQDYKAFYQREIAFRKMLRYPPYGNMCEIMFMGESEEEVSETADQYSALIDHSFRDIIERIGPADAPVAKVNNIYRKVLYIKSPNAQDLHDARGLLEKESEQSDSKIRLHFDYN